MTRPRSFLPVLVLLAATPVSAATLHVPSEYATIKAATTAAVAGDTVEVACGTYYEDEIPVNSGVVLRSVTGDQSCVTIDGESIDVGGHPVLICAGDSTTILEGLTITGGYGESNGGGGMECYGSPVVSRCSFVANGAEYGGGGVAVIAGDPLFLDCEFLYNSASGGGAVYGDATYYRCQFRGNEAYIAQGGAIFGGGMFTNCHFSNNISDGPGAAIFGGNVYLSRCSFIRNTNEGEGGLAPKGAVSAGYLEATECSFYENTVITYLSEPVPLGTAISAAAGLISRCVIAGNPCIEQCGTLVYSSNPQNLIIECTNIWDPVEDAWAGGIASQLGQNGNISVDPLFCGAAGGDFSLSSLSPCLDAPCGTMGAFGLGCYDAKPRIISIKDVGNDQGRQVRLMWYRANDDFAGSAFDGYAVYRRQDLFAAAPEAIQSSGRGAVSIPGWDYVTTIPNRWDNIYQAVIPTLCDSTLTSGQCWSAFFISALTPTAFYDSPVDSGYSKDNLAPPTPTSFAVSYNTGSGNHLVWDAVAANDWAGFRVYRGSTPNFTTSPTTLVHSTSQTTWNDPAFDGWEVSYKVTSFDAAGNESEPTGSTTVTVVGNNPRPFALELGPNVPNPFNPSTTIPFTIPSAGRVTITIYDVSGAQVRTLVNQEYQPGRHSAVWDGRNDLGTTVGSGVYLARLAHSGVVRSRKMVVTK